MTSEFVTSKWTARNGNACFRFSERQEFERPWIIVMVAVLLIAVIVTESLVNGSYYSLAPNCFVFFLIFLWWTTVPLKANEAVIEKTLHELMDERVENDANTTGTEVVKSFVHYDTKGTYAIITGRCFLVLLKNGVVWEYPIVYHKPTDKRDGYYECKKSYVVSENPEHIKAIQPKRWKRILAKFKLSDKAKLWLLILYIIIIGGISFAGSLWLVAKLKWWALLFIGVYYAFYETIEWAGRSFPGKVINTIKSVASLPLLFIYFLVALVQPFLTIVGTYFFVVLFAFGVPVIILTILSIVGWWSLQPETIAFLVIALGSMLCSSHSVTKTIIRNSPLKNWGNHTYESHRENLAFYLVHPSNMVFLIYLLYFVFLTISGYQLIQNGWYLISEEFDMSTLKAFLVYIAYNNMRTKAKATELDAKELLRRMSGLFVHDKL